MHGNMVSRVLCGTRVDQSSALSWHEIGVLDRRHPASYRLSLFMIGFISNCCCSLHATEPVLNSQGAEVSLLIVIFRFASAKYGEWCFNYSSSASHLS